jgi:hypothetical protein
MSPSERLRLRRMAYNENCPMFRHLPRWVRIVLAWELS